eukprot:2721025-Pyramimonas_sp.AAC.1
MAQEVPRRPKRLPKDLPRGLPKTKIVDSVCVFYLAWRTTQPYAAVNTAVVHIIFARVPYGATN